MKRVLFCLAACIGSGALFSSASAGDDLGSGQSGIIPQYTGYSRYTVMNGDKTSITERRSWRDAAGKVHEEEKTEVFEDGQRPGGSLFVPDASSTRALAHRGDSALALRQSGTLDQALQDFFVLDYLTALLLQDSLRQDRLLAQLQPGVAGDALALRYPDLECVQYMMAMAHNKDYAMMGQPVCREINGETRDGFLEENGIGGAEVYGLQGQSPLESIYLAHQMFGPLSFVSAQRIEADVDGVRRGGIVLRDRFGNGVLVLNPGLTAGGDEEADMDEIVEDTDVDEVGEDTPADVEGSKGHKLKQARVEVVEDAPAAPAKATPAKAAPVAPAKAATVAPAKATSVVRKDPVPDLSKGAAALTGKDVKALSAQTQAPDALVASHVPSVLEFAHDEQSKAAA
ncbi:MAG: hypothetical protein LBF84_01160 [Holosporales bacterium]|jgi:hypothetical protein|nr:hypothetical protein [Holosporales bacterium]